VPEHRQGSLAAGWTERVRADRSGASFSLECPDYGVPGSQFLEGGAHRAAEILGQAAAGDAKLVSGCADERP
jgi:hypothetical protein